MSASFGCLRVVNPSIGRRALHILPDKVGNYNRRFRDDCDHWDFVLIKFFELLISFY